MLRRLVHMHYRWLELSAAISEARILPHGRRRPRLVEEGVATTPVAQRGDTTSVTGVAHYTTRAQSFPKTYTRFMSRASAKAWCPESRFMQPEDDDPRPVPPIRPRAEDCCKGSCDPCIFDIYDVALYRYQDELRAWEERQARRHGNRP